MIRLERIRRELGARLLLDDVHWTIPGRARVGLVGPNGAGKTTLLRILAGRETPDGGEIRRPRELLIGYLPQEVETLAGGTVLALAMEGSAATLELAGTLERTAELLRVAEPGTAAAEALTARYGELRERFERLDGDRLEARARAVLSGLGVSAERIEGPIEALSGGWRMRVALARLLLARPGLLLLDEPTNHLDLDAIDWLETFLRETDSAYVVVSHDRYFLERMVDEIAELDRGKLRQFPGSYGAYLEARHLERERLEQAAKHETRERARVERFIERFRYKNTKARQVQSRIRALERRPMIVLEQAARRLRFGFPAAPRSGDVVARLDGVVRRFGARVVYGGLDLVLRRGDRLAVVGPNGSGKSTLLRLLAGSLEPDAGEIELGHGVIPRLYAQHQLEALDPAATALEELARVAGADERTRLRTLLGSFLFAGDDVDKRVAVLSGGEKARLALARLLLQPANLLLLDEPTSHLDLASREVLEEALDEYTGTLVVVSHDRYFINRVATAVAEVLGGRIEIVRGDYDEFVEWKRRRAADRAAAATEARSESAAPEPATPREARRDERRREAAERLAPLEDEITGLESRLSAIERSQTDEAVYSSPERAAAAARERSEVSQRLERLYAEWESLAETLEASLEP